MGKDGGNWLDSIYPCAIIKDNTMEIKTIVIGGVARSGTSLDMLVHCQMLGEHRMVGSKFMGRDDERKPLQGPIRKQSPIAEYKIKKRLERMAKEPAKKGRDFEDVKDMNPDGFCECPFTVKGLRWTPRQNSLFKKIEAMEEMPFVKIVSNAFPATDPSMVSSIVYMLRDPHEVARSQERLKRKPELPKGEVVHSPDFFITATVQFCRWYVRHGENIKFLLVEYHKLLADPEGQVQRIADFHGVPPNNAHKAIKQELHRSRPQSIPHPQWKDADAIYKLMQNKDFQGVLDYIKNPDLETHKQHARWKCYRLNENMTRAQCEVCKSDPVVVENFKKTAIKKKIDWTTEPCAYECGALRGMVQISVEDSIKDNHWK